MLVPPGWRLPDARCPCRPAPWRRGHEDVAEDVRITQTSNDPGLHHYSSGVDGGVVVRPVLLRASRRLRPDVPWADRAGLVDQQTLRLRPATRRRSDRPRAPLRGDRLRSRPRRASQLSSPPMPVGVPVPSAVLAARSTQKYSRRRAVDVIEQKRASSSSRDARVADRAEVDGAVLAVLVERRVGHRHARLQEVVGAPRVVVYAAGRRDGASAQTLPLRMTSSPIRRRGHCDRVFTSHQPQAFHDEGDPGRRRCRPTRCRSACPAPQRAAASAPAASRSRRSHGRARSRRR